MHVVNATPGQSDGLERELVMPLSGNFQIQATNSYELYSLAAGPAVDLLLASHFHFSGMLKLWRGSQSTLVALDPAACGCFVALGQEHDI